MVRKFLLSVVSAVAVCSLGFAQNRPVSGVVTSEDGSPLLGAIVTVQGTTTSSVTDASGRYTISAPATGSLEFTSFGLQTQVVAIENHSIIDVTMFPDATNIENVVVIESFGAVRKKDFTGSISAVAPQDISKVSMASVSRMLEGAVPGVQSYSTSGQPGNDASLIIRGIGSINAPQSALIVLDGVPYSSALSTINPLDIASVVVSKDAAANALYGSRAANGVVFVTTKKGNRAGRPNVMFEAKLGWNQQGVEEHRTMQNPGDYYEYVWNGLYNYHQTAVPTAPHDTSAGWASTNLLPALGNYMAYKIPEGSTLIDHATKRLNSSAQLLYADNYDDYLFTKPFRQEYTLSVSGGNKDMDYYVSGSFLDDPSYVIMSEFERYSARAAFNAQATSWLKLGTNISFTRRDIDSPAYSGANTGNAFLWTMWQNPTVPYYARDLDGKIRLEEDGSKMYESGLGTTLSPYGPTSDVFNSLNGAHPYMSMSRDIENTLRDNLYANVYAEIVFLKDFKFTTNFTMDNVYRVDTSFANNEYGTGTDPAYNGIVQKISNNYFSYNTQQMLNYTKNIGDKHQIDALIGHEYNKTKEGSIAAYKRNIFYPGIAELGNAVAQYDIGSTSSTLATAIEGYFTRLNYSFDNRYLFSASYRYDGTSRFQYSKWGHFWSVGGAWNVYNEEFMRDVAWIDMLKLRATYGVTGNQHADNYPYTNLWTIAESAGQIGISQSYTGNNNLSWERGKQVDVGVDFRLWDRFYGSIDYYNRRTHNIIWNRPTPSSTGLASRLENVGILGNSGFEFDLGVEIVKTKNVHWDFGVNAAIARNRLVDYPSELGNPALGGDYITGTYLRGKGKSYYNLYLFRFAGIDPETGQETFWKDVEGSNGTITREKVFNINEGTQSELGKDALPDMTGGLRTSFRWKNIDVLVTTAFQIGGLQWDGNSANLYDAGRIGFTVSQDLVGNTWTPENRDAKFPKLMYNGTWNFASSTSDALWRDASFFSLKTVNIGYTLPSQWMSKLDVQSLRVFFSADNLFFKSSHHGFDPRTGFTSQAGFGFPQAKTFTFGITLNL